MAVAATEEVAEATAAAGVVASWEAAILVRCPHEAGSLAAEWAHGVATLGTAATGVAATGTGIGTIGTAIGIITITTLALSSSATLAFRSGGVGVGTGDTRITVMAIATGTHTATAPHMDMDTTMAMATRMRVSAITAARTTEMATRMGVTTLAQAMEITIPPIQEWPSCNADLRGPGITLALSTESWGLGLDKQFALTSATMGMEAN